MIYVNVRSFIPQLHELRAIARRTRAACICISETCLDNTVPVKVLFLTIVFSVRTATAMGTSVYIVYTFANIYLLTVDWT